MGDNTLKIKEQCSGCGGTGQQPLTPTGTIECGLCNGTGKHELAIINISGIMDAISDLSDTCSDILDKCNDIMEKLNE